METFEIEVQEFLARVVKIEAQSDMDAILKVEEKYRKAEIVLDYNDFVEVNYLNIASQSKDDEKKQIVGELIEYLFEDEKRHFEGFEIEPENHMYKKLIRLKELNFD